MNEHEQRSVPPDCGQYQTIVETIPHLVWVAGPDGGLEYLNRQCLEYTGAGPGDLLGWDWSRVIHADDLPQTVASWKRSLATGAPHEVEFRLRRHDGVFRWHVCRALPERTRGGNVIRWFGTCTDIDDLKRSDALLRASEARFRAIVERSHDGFLLIDGERQVRYVSPAVVRVLGYLPEEFVGKDAWDWVHPDDRPGLSVWLADLLSRPGGTVEIWYRFRHRDGSYRRLEITATNFLHEKDVGSVVATFREVQSSTRIATR